MSPNYLLIVNDRLHFIRIIDVIRQRLIKVVESKIALFLGELDQMAMQMGLAPLVRH